MQETKVPTAEELNKLYELPSAEKEDKHICKCWRAQAQKECGKPAIARVKMTCDYGHTTTRWLCTLHLRLCVGGKLLCGPCLRRDGRSNVYTRVAEC